MLLLLLLQVGCGLVVAHLDVPIFVSRAGLAALAVVPASSRAPVVVVPAARAVAAASGLVQLAHVLLQVKVAAEALVAVAAGEGLLLVVRVHVEGQVVDLEI